MDWDKLFSLVSSAIQITNTFPNNVKQWKTKCCIKTLFKVFFKKKQADFSKVKKYFAYMLLPLKALHF